MFCKVEQYRLIHGHKNEVVLPKTGSKFLAVRLPKDPFLLRRGTHARPEEPVFQVKHRVLCLVVTQISLATTEHGGNDDGVHFSRRPNDRLEHTLSRPSVIRETPTLSQSVS